MVDLLWVTAIRYYLDEKMTMNRKIPGYPILR